MIYRLFALTLGLVGCARAVDPHDACGATGCRLGGDPGQAPVGPAAGRAQAEVSPAGPAASEAPPPSNSAAGAPAGATTPLTSMLPAISIVQASDCGSSEFLHEPLTERKPAHLVVVFDRSQSKTVHEATALPMDATADALGRALAFSAGDLVTATAVLFPELGSDAGGGCDDGDAGCIQQQTPDSQAACRVRTVGGDGNDLLDLLEDGAGNELPFARVASENRPLLQALLAADDVLTDIPGGRNVAVVIVTGGPLDCGWDQFRANELVASWQAAGIVTDALLLEYDDWWGDWDLEDLPEQSSVDLTVIAPASLRGVESPQPNASSMMLTQAFQDILDATLEATVVDPCTIRLRRPVDLPQAFFMSVRLPGRPWKRVPRELGWRLSNDGMQVVTEGRLCEAIGDGELGELSFEYWCPGSSLPRVLPAL